MLKVLFKIDATNIKFSKWKIAWIICIIHWIIIEKCFEKKYWNEFIYIKKNL